MNILRTTNTFILLPGLAGLTAAILQYLSYISPDYCDVICTNLVMGAYSTLFGIPIVYLSLTYFSLMISYALLNPTSYVKYFFIISLAASIISFYLLYLLLYVIEMVCVYCIIQNISLNTITFVLAFNILRGYRRESQLASS